MCANLLKTGAHEVRVQVFRVANEKDGEGLP